MTAVSVLDDKTTNAIRQALSAAASGRIADACAIGEQALGAGGDAAALNAMLGMLRFRSGDLEAAVRHLRSAREVRPTDPVVTTNLASALAQLGREEEALGIVTEDVARSDPSLQLMRLRGFLAQQLGEYDTAVRSYEHVVAAAPTDFESWNNLSNARRSILDHEGTLEAARRAFELRPDSAPVRLTYATSLEFADRVEEAEREYRRMAEDFPQDPHALRELFALLKSQYRDDDALEAIEEAVRRAPNDVDLVLGLASHRLTSRQHAAAEKAYRRILELEPDNKLGWIGLATVFDQINRIEDLAALVDEAEAANVAPEGLAFVKAFDHRRAKRYAEGLEALSIVPDELESARRQQLLGQLLEGAGRYDEAFAAFERMNAKTLEDPSDPEQRAAAYRDQVRRHRDGLTAEWVASWRDATVDDRPSPAFLVGFPRSGTTLLDTILMSHPKTEVLEEEPCLIKAMQVLGDFDAIPHATDETIRKARDAYFEEAKKLTPLDPSNLLIDKMPLSMNLLPFIRRLFPDARIILAHRHMISTLGGTPTTELPKDFETRFSQKEGCPDRDEYGATSGLVTLEKVQVLQYGARQSREA